MTFQRPFALAGVEGQHEPGTYAVETTEEAIDGLSFVAYRRVSTTITLPSAAFGWAARQVVTIEPGDLAAATAKDAELAEPR